MSNQKISDAEFLEILSENGGLFAVTAKAIQKKYQIPFSKQAVRQRAQKHPEFLKEIEEENVEIAHLTFLELMKQKSDLTVRFNTARYYAQTKGKAEFNTKLEEKPKTHLKQQVIKIGKTVLRFFVPANKNNPLI